MFTKVIGIGTLVMAITAILIGLAAISIHSTAIGIIYGIILVAGTPLILYSYCAKCPARLTDCAHYFPGILTRLLKKREENPYKLPDYLGVIIPALLFTLFPLPWLLESTYLLIPFLLLLTTAIVLINTKLCVNCSNKYCHLCKNCSVPEQ